MLLSSNGAIGVYKCKETSLHLHQLLQKSVEDGAKNNATDISCKFWNLDLANSVIACNFWWLVCSDD